MLRGPVSYTHLDSGCGFEIGLAYALGYPVNLITTDSYLCSVGDSVEMYHISKLVQYVAQVVHVFAPDPSIADYRTACEDLLQRALRQLKQNLIEEYGTRWSPRTALQAGEVEYDYYLDPNFKYTESGRKLLSAIRVILEEAGKTCTLGDNQGSIAEDISRLTKSGRAILLFDRVDTNVDSAVLNGIAYGIGRKPILYCSTEQTYKNGPAPNRLNIMNEYSSAAVVRSLKELERVIRQNS